MDKRYITVSALNKYMKAKVDQDGQLQSLYIKGEVSNVKYHRSGHIYFTLKDNESRINAMMFSSYAKSLDFQLKDGDQVLVLASVSVYLVAGTYQLYAKKIQLDGMGALFLRFEKLKQDLYKEGLFNEDHKKEIPAFPSKIAVLAGYPSDALMDVMRTIKMRFPVCRVVIFPIPVQGKNAYLQIIETLKYVDTLHFHTMIIARGGGSLEDLWNFNEEALARTIYQLQTPIISGVGHEADFTICDFVCDYRAATPTAAAVKATPDLMLLKKQTSDSYYSLQVNMKRRIEREKQRVHQMQSFYLFKNPEKLFGQYVDQLHFLQERMENLFVKKYRDQKNSYLSLQQSLIHQSHLFVDHQKQKLDYLNQRCYKDFQLLLKHKQENFYFKLSSLNNLSPLKTMERGYAIVTKDKHCITSVHQLEHQDTIDVRLKDGSIQAVVNKEDNYG